MLHMMKLNKDVFSNVYEYSARSYQRNVVRGVKEVP